MHVLVVVLVHGRPLAGRLEKFVVGGGSPDDHSVVAVDDILFKVNWLSLGIHDRIRDRSFNRLWKKAIKTRLANHVK